MCTVLMYYVRMTDIDTHCKQLIDVLLRAGNETLPQCKSNATDFGTPLWNDEIDYIREVVLLWHWIWIENGRPRLGHVADIMRALELSITILYVIPNDTRIIAERENGRIRVYE